MNAYFKSGFGGFAHMIWLCEEGLLKIIWFAKPMGHCGGHGHLWMQCLEDQQEVVVSVLQTTFPSKRALNDWEVTETARLLQVLNSFSGGKVLAEEEPVNITGDPSKLVSCGHCGRIEIQDVMKAKGPTTRRLEINTLVYFIFGVNRIQ
ncbi:hypothetical protein MTR67_002415 [Solanum verrucosum]|uniref:Uncharacterized protein n=1 Tax=Solanum verrucosum TaxID=315347 RepID=A0AAF0PTM0_SOLVR|nr:hypothetical protein MTR67_002415 [Solanum verrucosum]